MNEASQARRAFVIVALFVLACVGIVVYLFTGTQVVVPVLEQAREYEVSATVRDVDNLVPAGQVRIAGVEVGEVRSVERRPEGMHVVLALDEAAAPLHEGAKIRIGARSLVGETYLGVVDGTGSELSSGTHLPEGAVEPSVDVRELVHSLGPETRTELSGTLQSLGAGTEGRVQDVDAILTGFGKLGREGYTALDAVAAQSDALRDVVSETATLMSALDTSEGAIADLVSNGRRITEATAGQRGAIEASVRELPGTLESANTATASLTELAGALTPVAANLRESGTPLSEALQELPATSQDLRQLLPALDGTLDRAPATLDRIPTFGTDVRAAVPAAREILRDVNPALAYLRPYGPELGGFIANFNAILGYQDEAGVHYARLLALGISDAQQTPVDQGVTTYHNPYPAPGAGTEPGPFSGEYPRVERAPR